MVDDKGFSPAQLGSLFTFIARQMSKQQGAIAINRQLFDQVSKGVMVIWQHWLTCDLTSVP